MEALQRAWESFAGKVLELLPASPTIDNEALRVIAQYAGYINYFFPVGKFLVFLSATLVIVGAYYLAMAILRILRVIS